MSFQKERNVLTRYFSENNAVAERLTILHKIMIRIWGFLLCSIAYPLMQLAKNYNSIYGDELKTTDTIQYIHVIMVVCYVITGIGILWFLVQMVFPKFANAMYNKLSFTSKKMIFTILDWLLILPICCVVATFCYTFLFIVTPVTGTSMNPNIENGESVFISYIDKVDSFDVIVLKVTPEDNVNVYKESYYIKRVIGVPGQTVTWEDKVLKIDGQVVSEFYFPTDYLTQIHEFSNFDGNFKYKKDGQTLVTTVIPEGYYFVMGDNRALGKSEDSRTIGLIPKENVVGVAKYHMQGFIPWGKIA